MCLVFVTFILCGSLIFDYDNAQQGSPQLSFRNFGVKCFSIFARCESVRKRIGAPT